MENLEFIHLLETQITPLGLLLALVLRAIKLSLDIYRHEKRLRRIENVLLQ